jgi:predicted nucleotidyltransferase
MLNQTIIRAVLATHPHPLVFATVSGSHLYGFESADSDYDLRGAHVVPVRKLMGLKEVPETHELMDRSAPVEIDLVTHDVRKFFRLLLKHNGYVLEQVMSPLVVWSTPEFEELRALAPRSITRGHAHHFRGFSQNQWDMTVRHGQPTVKGVLYTYRVLLAGIHLMRTHQVESNLRVLNATFKLGYIDDLIERKVCGTERRSINSLELTRHEVEFDRLKAELETARDALSLPDEPSCARELEDLLIRLRMQHPN